MLIKVIKKLLIPEKPADNIMRGELYLLDTTKEILEFTQTINTTVLPFLKKNNYKLKTDEFSIIQPYRCGHYIELKVSQKDGQRPVDYSVNWDLSLLETEENYKRFTLTEKIGFLDVYHPETEVSRKTEIAKIFERMNELAIEEELAEKSNQVTVENT